MKYPRIPKMAIEHLVMKSRWLLMPMYLGLGVALGLYCYKFLEELWHLCAEIAVIDESRLLLGVLGLVDVCMIGNLIIMIIIGGYSIFIQRIDFDAYGADKPQGFNTLNSGALKVKMGLSLIGVSSIHLLKAFINAQSWTWMDLSKLLAIHGMFVLATLTQSGVDRIMHPTHTEKHHE